VAIGIDEIFAARKLKELFDLTGRVSLKLDEHISPVVVLETFNVSDQNRGPVEAFGGGSTLAQAAQLPWMQFLPDATADPPKAYWINEVIFGSQTQGGQVIFSIGVVAAGAGADTPAVIWQDRRFQPTLPTGFIRSQNAIVPAAPATGVVISQQEHRSGEDITYRPKRMILVPGHFLLVRHSVVNSTCNFSIQWSELDLSETSLGFR